MLTDENQALHITHAAGVVLGTTRADKKAEDIATMSPADRALAHKFVETVLEQAIALGVVAPRRFVDLRQL